MPSTHEDTVNASPESTRLQEHYEKVIDLSASERRVYMRALATDDPAMAREVQRLLDATDSGQEIEPVVHFDDDLLSEAVHARAFEDGEEINTPIGPGRVVRMVSDAHRIGQTEVYEVLLNADQRRIALKVLRSETSAGDLRRRFRIEAWSHSKLDHPGIASMLGAGAASGTQGITHAAIAMVFVDGITLDDWASDKQVVPEVAMTIAQVARTVHFANLRGIVHRDLKPQNIMVDDAGHPRLLDLGVAKLTDPTEAGIGQSLISVGETVVGTPRYMAPEQFTPTTRIVDLRADVYALGCILYELTTGTPPVDVEGLSTVETADAKRNTTVKEPHVSGVPRDLIRCAAHACAPSPNERYESCQALAVDIERAVDGLPLLERPPGARRRILLLIRRHPRIGVLVLLTLCITIGSAWVYIKLQQRIVMERDRAIARFDETRSFANWVIFNLDRKLSAMPGTADTRRQLIDRASSTLDALTADPEADDTLLLNIIDARLRIADVLLWDIGNPYQSYEQYNEVLLLLDRLDQPDSSYAQIRRSWIDLCKSYTSLIPRDLDIEEINMRAIRVFEQYETEYTDYATYWRWRADAEWRATRRLLDRRAHADEVLAMGQAAVAHADRAAKLDPADTLNQAEAANTRFWLAMAMFDLGDTRALSQADIAVESAETLSENYYHIGHLYLARAKTLRGSILSSLGKYGDAIAVMREALDIYREIVESDPMHFSAFRSSEVSHAYTAMTYLEASQSGIPDAAKNGLHHIRIALEHLDRRYELDWINPVEHSYRDEYTTIERQLLDAMRNESSQSP